MKQATEKSYINMEKELLIKKIQDLVDESLTWTVDVDVNIIHFANELIKFIDTYASQEDKKPV